MLPQQLSTTMLHLLLVHVQGCVLLCDHDISQEDRVVGDIATPQVEQPGHLVQGSDQQRISLGACRKASRPACSLCKQPI